MNRIIDFEIFKDDRGSLVSWEANQNIPFEIRRVYSIFGVEAGKKRGLHAHKTEEKVAVCIQGSCTILLNDGEKTTEILLCDPGKGLYIPRWTWLEMYDFSSDAILLVLSNSYFDENDYIWELKDFMDNIKQKDKSD